MSELSTILDRFGTRALAVIALVVAMIWILAHFTAAPGGEVSVLFGLVSYTKSVPEDGVEHPGEQPSPPRERPDAAPPEHPAPPPPDQSDFSPPVVNDAPPTHQEEPLPPVDQDPLPPHQPAPPVEQASEVRESSGFEISFFGCKTAGNETVCSFSVLNKMQDRSLGISGSGARNGAGVMISAYSRLIGPDGVEYRASWVEASNKRENVRLNHLFYSGIPTRTRVAFVGLPTDLSVAAILVVHFGSAPMQFKDVAIG